MQLLSSPIGAIWKDCINLYGTKDVGTEGKYMGISQQGTLQISSHLMILGFLS